MGEKNRYNKSVSPSYSNTIHSIISEWAKKTPNSIAVKALGRKPLSYGNLFTLVLNSVKTLNLLGVGINDRVAAILPNGPEMATSFFAVSSGATFVPLNPGFTADELRAYLPSLEVSAIIVQQEPAMHVTEIAEELGVRIFRLLLDLNDDAGVFTLIGEKTSVTIKKRLACSKDIALVAHTSGTTSRSKIVPLTHLNLYRSSQNISKTLKLTGADCCLNVMPLFHIHGLIGALLSSIYAGSSIICTPGFNAVKYYEWIRTFKPTWYTAVPTIHQAILERTEENTEIIKNSKLKFIRSSSSTLPRKLLLGIEEAFKVPVIESYGMTEASHQISSNLLPPKKRKQFSVGTATGTEISIIDKRGNFLPQKETGEIVIRGPTVTEGYEKDPSLNKESFSEGWFRTGDQGYLDEDNYLYITGRLKDIINRGGEKISPQEVDTVLLEHPSVNEVVSFSVPHEKLGEDIAAAVVLKQSARHTVRITEWDIQKFASKKLAAYKVPSKIVFLENIPKSPIEKIQRTGLAEKLGLTSKHIHAQPERKYVPPKTSTEKTLVNLWSDTLGLERVGVEDNYFQLGGDSILAAIILNKISDTLQLPTIPLVIFLHTPTIRKMAALIDKKELTFPPASLVAIQEKGSKPPLFLVHACDGEVLLFKKISRYLEENPLYALMSRGLNSDQPPASTVEEMAKQYVQEIQAFQSAGPYLLGGAGIGGIIAYEMALQLLTENKNVELLILFDTRLPNPFHAGIDERLKYYLNQLFLYLKQKKMLDIIKGVIGLARGQYRKIAKTFNPRLRVWDLNQKAVNNYVLKSYTGETLLILTDKNVELNENEHRIRINNWREYIKGPLNVQITTGKHLEIFKSPNAEILAEKLKPYLHKANNNMSELQC